MTKIAKFILLTLFFILLFGLFSVEIKDPDFFWHLKTGEYIYQHKALPETDPFAFTSLTKDPLHPESKRIKFILLIHWSFGTQKKVFYTEIQVKAIKVIKREGECFLQKIDTKYLEYFLRVETF